VILVIFNFQNCKNIQEQENKNKYNLSYRIDTLKIINKRYIHESGLGLEWYSIIAPYPVFTSDSIPEIIKEFNKNITENIEANVIKVLFFHYNIQLDNDYFSVRYDRNSKSDTGTVEERINFYMNTTKVDTLIFEFGNYIYISDNYVSIGIVGENSDGFSKLDIETEEIPLCFNMLISENRQLSAKECFKLKEDKLNEWKGFLVKDRHYPTFNDSQYDQYPDSMFIPVTFYQYYDDRFILFLNLPYTYERYKIVDILLQGAKISELEQFFDINYLNEIKKEKN
ncbi:MAG: hypothetical protein KAQ75_14055, partial [Bacteroidales bacterium]|nr:hypothetical protein [Bacteroidales bacterium]